MTHSIRSVCVYCGSSPGRDSAFADDAEALGNAFGEAGLRLVYGGGDAGLMGACARGVLAAGGEVLGVIPDFLVRKEQSGGAQGLERAQMVVVPDMHTRKKRMFDEADAFVALPGGIGTLEELVEMMTWAQLGRHDKPILLLDTGRFWSPFVALLDEMEEAGFLHTPDRVRPTRCADVPAVMAALS